jgi:hypothetical protein
MAACGLRAWSFAVLAASLLTKTLLAAEPTSSPTEKELPPCCRKVEASAPTTDKSRSFSRGFNGFPALGVGPMVICDFSKPLFGKQDVLCFP